jgi:alcohol dehydrogenase class IV
MNKQMFEFPLSYADPIPRIISGWGAHEMTGPECKSLKIKKALIVTTGIRGTGLVDEIKGSLNYHGIATEVFDKVTSNPKDYEVMEAYKVLKEAGCDGVVSIGGGSSHDCAKMARVVAANNGKDIRGFAAFLNPPWMEQMKKYKACTIPQVAVNTTAGTGSEVTSIATLTNTKVRAKQLVLVPNIRVSVAIVDPLITRMMPRHIAAWTGFDAMAHAYETYTSRVQSPYTSGLSLRAIQIISENLREFAYNRMNARAAEAMAYASTMAGLCLGLGSGAGMAHGLGHQISALTDAHHGLANAVLAIPISRYNQSNCPDRFADMARAMGVDTRGMSKMQASDKWFEETERLLKDLNIEVGHIGKQFGVKKGDFPHMVKIYSNDFPREGNPREYNYDEIIGLLNSIY